MINEELIARTQELVAIKSTFDKLGELQKAHDFMVAFVMNSGKKITIERFESGGRPSFLAYKGPKRPEKFHLILNGHVDVVPGKPEQFASFTKDGNLYGRGVYDMKAACIIMTDVFCEFIDKVPFALGLQIVTDEENSSKDGTLHQVQQGVRGDFVICGECGRAPNTHEIANRSKGIVLTEIGFRGKSAHSAYPWKGENAATRANRFVHALNERYPEPTEATTESTITITGISAVSEGSTITPDYATVKLNARFVKDDPELSNMPNFTAFIKELDPAAEIIGFHDFSSAFYTDPQNPQLQRLKTAAEKVEGHPFEFVQHNGTSDARFYGDVDNEACEFGIAGEHQHGDDEYISLKAFEQYRETLREFLASEI